MKETYAIYKNDIGLYAWEYVACKEDAKRFLFYPFTTDKDYPVIVNAVGGKTSFVPSDPNFVEFRTVEEGENPLKREEMYPKNYPEFKYGWIDTEGNTYACHYEDHYDAAKAICEEMFPDEMYNPERFLEKQNWIKVTRSSSFTQGLLVEDYCITKSQYETLVNLGYDVNSEIMKFYYNYSSKRW
jgi:hypothetical protein